MTTDKNEILSLQFAELRKDLETHITEYKADKEKVHKFLWSLLKWAFSVISLGVIWFFALASNFITKGIS